LPDLSILVLERSRILRQFLLVIGGTSQIFDGHVRAPLFKSSGDVPAVGRDAHMSGFICDLNEFTD
jgi:hypothetical protein